LPPGQRREVETRRVQQDESEAHAGADDDLYDDSCWGWGTRLAQVARLDDCAESLGLLKAARGRERALFVITWAEDMIALVTLRRL
jgi:hypothetical protein